MSSLFTVLFSASRSSLMWSRTEVSVNLVKHLIWGFFAELIFSLTSVTIFAQSLILDVLQGSEYISGNKIHLEVFNNT